MGWLFYPSVGGVETIMVNLTKYLASKYDLTILTSPVDGQEKESRVFGARVIRKEFMRAKADYPDELLRSEFNQILDEVAPEIIHFHNSSYPFPCTLPKVITMFEEAKSRNISMIEHSHNAQSEDPVGTETIRNLPWDYVICVSNFVKSRWDELGNNAAKITVVYNGIDREIYSGAKPDKLIKKLSAGKKVILFPARIISVSTCKLNKRKNFLLVLKACSELIKDPRHNFVLVGIKYDRMDNKNTSETEAYLQDTIKDLGLDNNVFFVPKVAPEKMPGYYSASDVVCVPSLGEPFGLVFVESMAAGKVVIGANEGGAREIIEDGKNGFLINPSDHTSLANKICAIFDDNDLENKMSKAALKRAGDFDYSVMGTRVDEVYQNILEKK